MAASAQPAVVHAADYGGAYPGNFVASLRALAGPCRRMGLRLVLGFSANAADRPWLDDLRAEGIPVHVLDRRASLAARSDALSRLSAAEGAALLHTHFTRWDVPGFIAAARRKSAIVWHLHSPFPAMHRIGFLAKTAVKLRLLGRRARVAAVSQAILGEAVRRGFPARRATYVPNAIDVAHATHAREDRAEVRRRLGVPRDATVALAFGWEPVRKGVDLALDAGAALVKEGHELVLVLVGTEALEEFVRERIGRSLPAWLRLLRPREHVGELYGAADVFLSASRAEGFPYAVGEAFANGLPVVVSDIPGVEWAREVPGSILVRPGDAQALAGAIRDVAGWPAAQRLAFGVASRAFVTEQLSLEAWAERVVDVYRAALAER